MFLGAKKIHFVGIGGIGVSALAKWAVKEGAKVSGSDVVESEETKALRQMGCKIFIGHKAENVPLDAELLIYSFAVPKSNSERKIAIPQKSYFEVLAEISRGRETIAVSGTNGKSTTAAMLGKILLDAGYSPTVIVGSKIKDFKYGNLEIGKSDLLVVEACEHNAHMLLFYPRHIVLTNIEEDHLDFYKNLDNIRRAFAQYVTHPAGGFIVYNKDDKNILKIIKKAKGRTISYGRENADFQFIEREVKDGRQFFKILEGGRKSCQISLSLPGLFNVYNALAAASAARGLGVPPKLIAKSLSEFGGLWRRFQKVGEFRGAPVISDYGHHPQAVAATVLAAREFYPERRLVLAFEPHQHHRTAALFADFVRSFNDVDVLILSEIYNVEGRVEAGDKDISSRKLAKAIIKYWQTDEIQKKERRLYYAANLDETERIIKKNVKKNDLVIMMGAGDIYKVSEKLCKM